METKSSIETISADQLQTGLFVCLEEHWLKHPFLLNNFKIKNEKQLSILKRLGISAFRYDPDRSDRPPLPAQARDSGESVQASSLIPEVDREFQLKQERQERLTKIKERIAATARQFSHTVEKVPNLMSKLLAGRDEGLNEVDVVVGEMVGTFVSLSDTVMHLMDSDDKDQELSYHFLNVSVLSLLLGHALRLPEAQLNTLGAGALMHDLGKLRIEKKYWRKPREVMNKYERELFELHPKYGVEVAANAGVRDKEILSVIGQHHERMDGFGYPEGLKGREVHLLTKIATIANIFDNLCNHYDPAQRFSPYAALQLMFKKYDTIIDMGLFSLFVKRLGVYPPGTIVVLTNEVVAKVMAVNPNHPLTPIVMPFESGISSKDAVVLDLSREEFQIRNAVPVEDLSPSILRYLKPKGRVSYFMEALEAET